MLTTPEEPFPRSVQSHGLQSQLPLRPAHRRQLPVPPRPPGPCAPRTPSTSSQAATGNAQVPSSPLRPPWPVRTHALAVASAQRVPTSGCVAGTRPHATRVPTKVALSEPSPHQPVPARPAWSSQAQHVHSRGGRAPRAHPEPSPRAADRGLSAPRERRAASASLLPAPR